MPINVEIDGKRFTELHVDGSVTASVFLRQEMVGIGRNGMLSAEAGCISVSVIVAGKLCPDAVPAKRELFSISGESMTAVLQTKLEGDLTQLFLLARYAKADFKLTGIRQDYVAGSNSMSFDPQVMRTLFDEGFHAGTDRTAWRSSPPGLEMERFAPPRSNTRFATVPGASSPSSWTPEKIRITLDGDNSVNGR